MTSDERERERERESVTPDTDSKRGTEKGGGADPVNAYTRE